MKRMRVLSFCISLFSCAVFSSDMAAPGGEAVELNKHFNGLSEHIHELIDSDDVYFDLFSSFSSCEGGDFVAESPADRADDEFDLWFAKNYFFYNGDLTRDAVIEALNAFIRAVRERADFEVLCQYYPQLVRELPYETWPEKGFFYNALTLFIIRSTVRGCWSFRYGYEVDIRNPYGDDGLDDE